MSNIHNERILEELFDKHLEIVERDFDLPEEVQEQIAEARAVEELDVEEDFYSYFIQKYNVDTKKEIEENDR